MHLPPPVTRRAAVDDAIAAIARDQFGLITTWQLHECGLTPSAITRRCHARRLFRVHPSVYSVAHAGLAFEARTLAAILSIAGADEAPTAGAGMCALRIWGSGRWATGSVDVVSTRRHRGLRDVRVRYASDLPADERVVRAGIPITSVARTIVDLATDLTAHQLAYVIHQARYRRQLRIRDLDRLAARHRHRAGAPTLRIALELHRAGSAGTRSGFEDRFLAAIIAAGVPMPEVNVPVAVVGGVVEVDEHWPEARICVELDGPGHDLPRDRRRDPRNQARLEAAGWHVVRVHHQWFEAGVHRVVDLVGANRAT